MRRALLILLCLAAILCATCACAQVRPSWWHRPVPVAKPLIAGTVASVSSTSIGVQTTAGVKTFAVGPKTKVVVQGKMASINDIKVGDPVRVHPRKGSVALLAAKIIVPKPAMKGKITALGDNSFTLNNKAGEFTVSTTGDTRFTSHGLGGYQGTFADLRVGFGVAVEGETSGNTIAADWIQFSPLLAKGAVSAVDASTITVKTVKQAAVVTAPSEKTVVFIRPRVGPNKRGTLDDVKVGLPVNIGFTPNKSGTPALLWIEVLTGM